MRTRQLDKMTQLLNLAKPKLIILSHINVVVLFQVTALVLVSYTRSLCLQHVHQIISKYKQRQKRKVRHELIIYN